MPTIMHAACCNRSACRYTPLPHSSCSGDEEDVRQCFWSQLQDLADADPPADASSSSSSSSKKKSKDRFCVRKMVVGCTDGHSDPALIQAERDSSLDAKAKEVETSGVEKGLRMTNAADAHAQAAAAAADADAHAQAAAAADADAHAQAAAAAADAAADVGAPSRKTKAVADAAAAAAAEAAEAAEAALLHTSGATPATGEGTWVLGDRPLSSASSDQVRQTPFLEPFVYKNVHFTQTGSGQT